MNVNIRVLLGILGTSLMACGVVGLCNEFYYHGKKRGREELKLVLDSYHKGKIDGAKEMTELLQTSLRII